MPTKPKAENKVVPKVIHQTPIQDGVKEVKADLHALVCA
jgi:hypothetical protein